MRLRGVRLGSTIGAIGGVLFVLINAGDLPGGLVLRVVGAAFFVATMVVVLRTPDSRDAGVRAGYDLRLYWIATIAEVVAIPVGARVLVALDHAELSLVWVVFVLGVHFLPFARAFRTPVFAVLGLLEITIALVGGGFALSSADLAPDWTGVVAGYVLIGFAAVGVLLRPVHANHPAAATATTPHDGHSSEGANP